MLNLCFRKTLQVENIQELLTLIQPCIAYFFLCLTLDTLFGINCENFKFEHLPLGHEIYSGINGVQNVIRKLRFHNRRTGQYHCFDHFSLGTFDGDVESNRGGGVTGQYDEVFETVVSEEREKCQD
jgi:hypothetical protein